MAGFTAVIKKKGFPMGDVSFRDKFYLGSNDAFVTDYIRSEKFTIERFTNSKFMKDKVFSEDDKFIIGIEGVLMNLKSLRELTGTESTFDVVRSLYSSENEDFVKLLKGDFSGFIYSKEDESWLIFTNQTGSKRLFYFQNEDYLIFSSDLKEISFILNSLDVCVEVDVSGAYSLLTYGFMLNDNTLVSEVKRLLPGNCLLYENNQVKVGSYFNLSEVGKATGTKQQIINKIDELFCNAIKQEFEKDKEYGYKHIATLSGGLDSRMTVLVADKLGYKNQLNFTFSQSNYLDELISKKIASDYRHEFLFQSLDNGNFLKEIEKIVYVNDGLVLYSGAAHMMDSLENINFSDYGIIHTGQIGDAVLGSFLSKPFVVKPVASLGAYSTRLLSKIQPFAQSVVDSYPTEELFKFYTRGFLGALNGNYYMDIFTQAVSPFLDIDFLSYCYSIPEKYKYKQQIYLEWIASKHPEFDRYPWEKTGVPPLKSMNYKRYFDIRYYKRMKLKFMDKVNKKMHSGMNPFDEWLDKNPGLKAFVEDYFQQNIGLLSGYPELQADSKLLYTQGNLNEKLQVLTLLAAVKLHFQTKTGHNNGR